MRIEPKVFVDIEAVREDVEVAVGGRIVAEASHFEHDIASSGKGFGGGGEFVEFEVTSFNEEASAVGHGGTGAESHLENGLFDPFGFADDGIEIAATNPDELDTAAEQTMDSAFEGSGTLIYSNHEKDLSDGSQVRKMQSTGQRRVSGVKDTIPKEESGGLVLNVEVKRAGFQRVEGPWRCRIGKARKTNVVSGLRRQRKRKQER